MTYFKQFLFVGKCVVQLKASNKKWNEINWKQFKHTKNQQFQCTWTLVKYKQNNY